MVTWPLFSWCLLVKHRQQHVAADSLRRGERFGFVGRGRWLRSRSGLPASDAPSIPTAAAGTSIAASRTSAWIARAQAATRIGGNRRAGRPAGRRRARRPSRAGARGIPGSRRIRARGPAPPHRAGADSPGSRGGSRGSSWGASFRAIAGHGRPVEELAQRLACAHEPHVHRISEWPSCRDGARSPQHRRSRGSRWASGSRTRARGSDPSEALRSARRRAQRRVDVGRFPS
jgi:hypothetical protein